jgi:hypothetical protein
MGRKISASLFGAARLDVDRNAKRFGELGGMPAAISVLHRAISKR